MCNGLDTTSLDCLAKTYSNIATCLNKLENFEGAKQMAFRSLEKKPDFPKPYLHLSKSFGGLENPAMARLCLLKGKTLAAADPSTFSSALRKLDSPDHLVAWVSCYIHKVANGRAWQVDVQEAAEEKFGEVSLSDDSEYNVPLLVESSTDDSDDTEQELKKSKKSGAANKYGGLAPRDLPGLVPDVKGTCSGSTSGVSGLRQAKKEGNTCSKKPAWQSGLRGFFDKESVAEAEKGKKSQGKTGMQKEAEKIEQDYQNLFQKLAKRRQMNAEEAEKIKHQQMKTDKSKKKQKESEEKQHKLNDIKMKSQEQVGRKKKDIRPPLSDESDDMEQELSFKAKKKGAANASRGLAPRDLPGLVSGVGTSCSGSTSRLSGKSKEAENRERESRDLLQKEANRRQTNAKAAEEKIQKQMETDKRKKSEEIIQQHIKVQKDSKEKQCKLNDIKMKSQEQVGRKEKIVSTGNCSKETVKKDASPLEICQRLLEEGFLAFQNGFMATAVDRFNPALDIHMKNLQGTHLVTLNYVFARYAFHESLPYISLNLGHVLRQGVWPT